MSRFDGKVAFVTGAARGQGRAHAVAFAREGAALALVDSCSEFDGTSYEGATSSDLDETVRLCEAEGAKVVVDKVDVRDFPAMQAFADRAVAEHEKVDIVVANAGIFGNSPIAEQSPEMFSELIDVNLKGVFHTIRVVLPGMIERRYGRVIATGSVCSLMGVPGVGHYVASKHGVAGLIKSIAKEVGQHGVTANYVVPNGVGTKMIRNEATYRLMSPDNPTEEAALAMYAGMNAIPLPWVEPEDVSKVVLFLASEDGRYTTGAAMKVDLGATA
jgi:SDR family mycofactocin-dependent oxidoreductase